MQLILRPSSGLQIILFSPLWKQVYVWAQAQETMKRKKTATNTFGSNSKSSKRKNKKDAATNTNTPTNTSSQGHGVKSGNSRIVSKQPSVVETMPYTFATAVSNSNRPSSEPVTFKNPLLKTPSQQKTKTFMDCTVNPPHHLVESGDEVGNISALSDAVEGEFQMVQPAHVGANTKAASTTKSDAGEWNFSFLRPSNLIFGSIMIVGGVISKIFGN